MTSNLMYTRLDYVSMKYTQVISHIGVIFLFFERGPNNGFALFGFFFQDQDALIELKERIHESMDPEQVLYDAIVVKKQRPELYENEGSYTFYPWTLKCHITPLIRLYYRVFRAVGFG